MNPESNSHYQRAVLGAYMLDTKTMADGRLEKKHFLNQECARLFSAIRSVFLESGTITPPLLRDKDPSVKMSFIAECLGDGVSPMQCKLYEQNIIDYYTVATAREIGKDMQGATTTVEIEKRVNQAAKIISDMSESEDDGKDLSTILSESIAEDTETPLGAATGVPDLDRHTKRLKEAHVWVIGGYTGTGKTWLSLKIASEAAKYNLVHFYSIEMTSRDLVRRLYHMGTIAHNGDMSAAEKWIGSLSANLRIYQDKFSFAEIALHLLAQPEKPKVVFIDFLQNLESEGDDEYAQINKMVRSFQKLAKKLKCCFVLLSQVNNEGASGGKRKVMPFKGSGNIASTVDIAIVLERDEEEETEVVDVNMYVKKNRHGMAFDSSYKFNKRNAKITFPGEIPPKFSKNEQEYEELPW